MSRGEHTVFDAPQPVVSPGTGHYLVKMGAVGVGYKNLSETVARGLVIGNIVGLGVVFIQRAWHLLPLDPEAYYLDYVPVEINWWWVAGLNVAVVVIAALVLILPSRIIATLSPASSMRYE